MIEQIKGFWYRITYLGVDFKMPYSIQKKTLLCNKLSLLSMVLIFSSVPILSALNIKGYQTQLMLMIIALAMASVPVLNYLNQTNFTRLALSFFSPIVILVYTLLTKYRHPEEVEAIDYFVPRALIFLTLLLPLVLLDFKHSFQMVFGTISNVICLLFFDVWHNFYDIGYTQLIDPYTNDYNQINLVYLISVSAVIMAFYFYQRTNDHFEKENQYLLQKVQHSNDELTKKKEQLEEAYNELKQIDEEIRQNSEELQAINENLIQTRDELKTSFDREKRSKEQLAKTNEELKNAQMQIIQSEKMASLGQLTAGVAHEINNPINFVYAGANTLRSLLEEFMEIINIYDSLSSDQQEIQLKETIEKIERLKDDQEYYELKTDIEDIVKDIIIGADRTAAIVKGLRNFSRLDEDNLKMANINDCIDSTLVILSGQFRDNIDVVKDFDADIPMINCYPGQLNQVFLNLLNNSRQAIKKEGEIKITTRNFDETIQISIKDTGIGIPSDLLNKIFEPFYTTKEVGEGTGLGLSISYGIIEKHKGKIEVNSTEGVGTEFIIEISKNIEATQQVYS
ncbi:ATP-binding protein [Chondrinema litorale]|uniref:ATP-binding protein n=1 Tax=Chondrinema litorale TaxID=2994555 RepID=UPI002542EB04|nr:ATP-binding protein [Chondrinema litorale]UZR93994.1 ATP-binding protein [Chondrinema litorale]